MAKNVQLFPHKVDFLLALTSARQVFELAALFYKNPVLGLQEDKVVLHIVI